MSGILSILINMDGAPFMVSITPEVTGVDVIAPITTDLAEIVVSGGVGPFTYLWSFSGDPGVTILAPTAPMTAFRASPIIGEPRTGIASCLVTDGTTGASVRSDGCAVTITRI